MKGRGVEVQILTLAFARPNLSAAAGFSALGSYLLLTVEFVAG
jgi:hypothetical protein